MKFEEWATQTSAPNRRCKVCALPDAVFAEVSKARAAGYGTVTLSKFLAAQGYRVTSSSLENHFARGNGHGK